MDGSRQHPSLAYRASSSGTLIVACRSTPSQLCDDFNEFLLLLEIMVDFVALRGLPSAHFGKLRGGLQFAWKADLASGEQFAMRIVWRGVAWLGCDDLAQNLTNCSRLRLAAASAWALSSAMRSEISIRFNHLSAIDAATSGFNSGLSTALR